MARRMSVCATRTDLLRLSRLLPTAASPYRRSASVSRMMPPYWVRSVVQVTANTTISKARSTSMTVALGARIDCCGHTARCRVCSITAGSLAIGTNLNGYRQTQTPQGVQVVLGDLARPREFWLELTSPIPLQADVRAVALVRGTAVDDVPEEASSELLLRVTTDLQSVPEDAALVRELAAVIRAQGVGEAAEQYDSGNYAGRPDAGAVGA